MTHRRIIGSVFGIVAAAELSFAAAATAQIPFTPVAAPAKPSGVVQAWPAQNPNGPTGIALQTNYPYPGQCLADPRNTALFPLLTACPMAGSFSAHRSARRVIGRPAGACSRSSR